MKRVAILTEDFIRWSGGIDLIKKIILAVSNEKNKSDIDLFIFIPAEKSYKQYSGLKRMFNKFKDKHFSTYKIKDSYELLDELGKLKFIEYKMGSLPRILKQLKIDIVFPVLKPEYAKIKIPTFFYIFDCQHNYFPEFFSEKEINARDKMFKKIVGLNKKILVNAKSVKNDLVKFHCANPDNIYVLPFTPLVENEFFEDNIELIKKYNLPEKYFIISNQFWKHKDHATAFKAFAQLPQNPIYANVELICTGDTIDHRNSNYFNELTNLLKELGIENKVHCLGLIPKREQIEILKNSVALIQPTLFEGGPGGGSVQEAISLGVKSIVSDIETNLEIDNELVAFFNKQDSHDLCKKMLQELNNNKSGRRVLESGNTQNMEIFRQFWIELLKV